MFILFLSDGTESVPFDDTEISPPRKIPSYLMIRKYRLSIAFDGMLFPILTIISYFTIRQQPAIISPTPAHRVGVTFS